jgi:hypothetical protein
MVLLRFSGVRVDRRRRQTVDRLTRPVGGRQPGVAVRLPGHGIGARHAAMKRVFDMDDRARMPWRFFGRRHRPACDA